jgi:hypothetical protein
LKSFDAFEATTHATTESVAAMEVFKSYWDTLGSLAEEETQHAAHPVVEDVVSPFDGAEELDPDQLTPVDPAEEERTGVFKHQQPWK